MLPSFELLDKRNCPSTIALSGTVLVFDDIGGVDNYLSITVVESEGMTKFRFEDTSGEPIELPPDPPEGWLIINGGAEIPGDGVTKIRVLAQQGDDIVNAPTISIPLDLFGDYGSDTLYGGTNSDTIVGGRD